MVDVEGKDAEGREQSGWLHELMERERRGQKAAVFVPDWKGQLPGGCGCRGQ